MAKDDKYDFGFIALALGLVPVSKDRAGINPGAIVYLTRDDDGATITMHGGKEIYLTPDDLTELEETIKRRGEEAKAIQKEAMRNQMIAQQEVFQEVNSRVQPGQIIGALPTKRGRN